MAALDIHAGDALVLLGGHVYMRALMTVPAMCRIWFNDAPRKTRDIADRYCTAAAFKFQMCTIVTGFFATCRYTTEHISPLLITHEVETLKKRAGLAGEMRVKGSALKRCVTAMYQGRCPRLVSPRTLAHMSPRVHTSGRSRAGDHGGDAV